MDHIFAFIVRRVLTYRAAVLVIGALLMMLGIYTTVRSPIDILPDLNRPTVTVFTEAEGYATEEVETLVTLPIESVMNGAPGVQRVRSISTSGLSMIFVEFNWGQDIYLARQIVSEKLQSAPKPDDVKSVLGPVSSIMGEIQLIGLTSPNGNASPAELRRIADFTIKPKLLTVPGVAQVTAIGGAIYEYQINIDPVRLAANEMTVNDLLEKLDGIVENRNAGFVSAYTTEYPVRFLARTTDLTSLEQTVIGEREGGFVTLRDVATVTKGVQMTPRGDAGINGNSGVVLSITKQPGINTLLLGEKIQETLAELQTTLGSNVKLHTDLFKQEKFIENGIENVTSAARDAAILVAVILIFFLANARAVTITLLTLPLSFMMTILVLRIFDVDINVMTLGGLAVAVGELTDDAIVDVENTIRWLRNHKKQHSRVPISDIVLRASMEVRGSIVFSTILIALVFIPIFALDNIEGRLLMPLAVSYLVALIASMIVAMTVTVALCRYLLPNSSLIEAEHETRLVMWLKSKAAPIVRWSIRNPRVGIGMAVISILMTAGIAMQAGKEFLPPFNEGSLTIGISLPPGTSLTQSQIIGRRVEKALLEIPEVGSVARRTGRAEEDEHANGVNISELEVDIDIHGKRSKNEIVADVRAKLDRMNLQKANISIGQPVTHRIEHIMSGVRAPIVIKVFGPDLTVSRGAAEKIQGFLANTPGALNPVVEQEVAIPQVTITPDRAKLALYGFTMQEFGDLVETLTGGEVVGTLFEGSQSFPLVARVHGSHLDTPEHIAGVLIETPSGTVATIGSLATVTMTDGRNTISHDNGQRRIVVSSGILDGDSVTIVEAVKKRIEAGLELPPGYYVSYEGTYQSQKASSQRLLLFAALSLLGIIAVLYAKFRSFSLVLQVLINMPATFLGGMLAIAMTGNVISLASLVGLISLMGLASRNGILLIEHWLYMATEEKQKFGEDMIIAGSLDRLSPMLMTSLSTILALVPLILAAEDPGKELLHPLSVVMFGGLLTSTLVEIIVRPGMFYLWGRRAVEEAAQAKRVETVPEKSPLVA